MYLVSLVICFVCASTSSGGPGTTSAFVMSVQVLLWLLKGLKLGSSFTSRFSSSVAGHLGVGGTFIDNGVLVALSVLSVMIVLLSTCSFWEHVSNGRDWPRFSSGRNLSLCEPGIIMKVYF